MPHIQNNALANGIHLIVYNKMKQTKRTQILIRRLCYQLAFYFASSDVHLFVNNVHFDCVRCTAGARLYDSL